MSASISCARRQAARSLSMTAATPLREPSGCSSTGTPPPPQAMVTVVSHRVRMVPISTMRRGLGEGTTRRQPRPESSFMVKPFSSSSRMACSSV